MKSFKANIPHSDFAPFKFFATELIHYWKSQYEYRKVCDGKIPECTKPEQ